MRLTVLTRLSSLQVPLAALVGDGRGQPLQVTVEGNDLLTQIGPAWRKAQDLTHKLIGEDGAALLRKLAASMSTLPS